MVTFPFLNLKISITKIAFRLFDIDIYWYGIIIVAAIIISMLICQKNAKLFKIDFEDILNLYIILIPISLIGARIYYIIFNLEYYLQNTIEIINIRSGGLAIYGGIIGGVLAIYVYSKFKKIELLNILDLIAISLPLSQSIGRWGNFINIEAYGTETNLPWRMGIYEKGIYKEVHPTFLYESLATFIIFLILNKIKNKIKFKGQITYMYITLYSFARFFIEKLRIDSLMLVNIRISQILSLFLFVYFCSILVYKIINLKKKSQSEKKYQKKRYESY